MANIVPRLTTVIVTRNPAENDLRSMTAIAARLNSVKNATPFSQRSRLDRSAITYKFLQGKRDYFS